MPPTTAALNALMPGRKPVEWITLRNRIPHRIPAIPAMAPPTAKTFTMVRFTSMPIRAAISASSATARIALPDLVRLTKYHRPVIDTAATTITKILAPSICTMVCLSLTQSGTSG